MKFKTHFKELFVPFKIHLDFESILKWIKRNDKKKTLHILKNIKITFLAVLLTKLYVLVIDLENQLSFTEEKIF